MNFRGSLKGFRIEASETPKGCGVWRGMHLLILPPHWGRAWGGPQKLYFLTLWARNGAISCIFTSFVSSHISSLSWRQQSVGLHQYHDAASAIQRLAASMSNINDWFSASSRQWLNANKTQTDHVAGFSRVNITNIGLQLSRPQRPIVTLASSLTQQWQYLHTSLSCVELASISSDNYVTHSSMKQPRGVYIKPPGLLQLRTVRSVWQSVTQDTVRAECCCPPRHTNHEARSHQSSAMKLQWFPVNWSVEFKVACLIHQSFNDFISSWKVVFALSDRQLTNVLPHPHATLSVTQVLLLPVLVYGTVCHRTSTTIKSSARWKHFCLIRPWHYCVTIFALCA